MMWHWYFKGQEDKTRIFMRKESCLLEAWYASENNPNLVVVVEQVSPYKEVIVELQACKNLLQEEVKI